MAEGGCIVKLYMNIELVVAILDVIHVGGVLSVE